LDSGGLVESWANGLTWRELCKQTNLDQGDICRMLRRTVETLKQIPLAFNMPPKVSQLAYEAVMKMDRFYFDLFIYFYIKE
jgi:superfamily II RNA helicase